MSIAVRRLLSIYVVLCAALLVSFEGASAEEFPNRQVTLVVPFAPGATVDGVARALASKLSSFWNVPVLVENRPGGSTTVGAKFVAEAKPDGHTLFLTTSETYTVVPHIAQFRAFKPMEEFEPINLLAILVDAFIVNPSLQVSTLPELIAYAKSNPTALRYSSPGTGSNIHLAMEMLKAQAKIEMQHVPYRGLAPATTAVLTNEVQVGLAGYSARQLAESGKVRVIAVAGPGRFAAFPNIPSTAELGYPKVDTSTPLPISASKKVPRDVLDKINADVSRALNDPEVQRQFTEVRGLVVANVGLGDAARELQRLSKSGAEMVGVAKLDRE